MELREKLLKCIKEGGWQSCPEDVRSYFSPVDRLHLDHYLREGCEYDYPYWVCRTIDRIYDDGQRFGIVIKTRPIESNTPPPSSVPELRRWAQQLDPEIKAIDFIVVGYVEPFANIGSVEHINAIRAANNSDEFVVRTNFYDYIDADHEEVTIAPDGRVYRVQGDITISGRPYRGNPFLWMMVRRLVDIVLESVAQELTRLGIAFTMDRDGYIYIPTRNFDNMDVIVGIIKKIFGFTDARVSGNGYTTSIEYRCFDRSLEVNVLYRYDISPGFHINIDISGLVGIIRRALQKGRCLEKFRQLIDDVSRILSSIKRVESFKVTIGNHVAEFYNAYPLSITAPISVNLGEVERRYLLTLGFRRRSFYADEHTRLVMRHPEHGEVRIKFTAPGIYRFGHVPHWRDEWLTNDAILSELSKSSMTSSPP